MTGTSRAIAAFTAALAAVAVWPGAFAAEGPAPTFLDDKGQDCFVLDGVLKGGTSGTLVFCYQDDGSHYQLTLDGKRARFAKIQGGATTPLGLSSELPAGGGDHRVVIARGPWRMACYCDGVLVAKAWDDALTGGKVGSLTTAPGKWDDVGVQPVEREHVLFTDNHMRPKDSLGTWEPVTGSWRTLSLEEADAGSRKPELSANAFSLLGTADDKGLVVTSGTYGFWSDYLAETAVRCNDTGAVGLVFYYQNPQNYLLYRWTSRVSTAEDANRQQLIEVVGGAPTVLAEKAGGHVPNQWYLMRVQVCDGLVRCFIDDEPQLSARTRRFGMGQVGFYIEKTKWTTFDDARVEAIEVDQEDFASSQPGKWIPVAEGRWQVQNGVLQCRQGSGADVLGLKATDHFVLGADVSVPSSGMAGLAFGQRDGGLYALRLGGLEGKTARVQVVRCEGKQEQVLDDQTAEVNPKAGCRLKLWVQESVVRGYVDSKLVVEALTPAPPAGRVGLYANDAPSASFDNVYVAFLPPPRKAQLTAEFTDTKTHFEMAEWSDPDKAPWVVPADGATDKTFWSKGDYYGDTTLEITLPDLGQRAGSAVVRLGAREDSAESGLSLTLTAGQGSKTLKASLKFGGDVVAEGQGEAQATPAKVRVARRGSVILVDLDGKPLLQYRLKQGKRGGRTATAGQ